MIPPPGMINEQLGIDAKPIIQKGGIGKTEAGNIPHGVKAMSRKTPGRTGANTPKVRQGLMAPQSPAIGGFIKKSNTYP